VSSLQGEVRGRVRALADLVVARSESFGLEPARQAVYDGLFAALAQRVQVRIGYIEPGSTSEYSTKVSPYRLVVGDRGCSLVGRSTVHRVVRVFRLPWVQWVELTDDPSEIPPRFDLDRFLGQAWDVDPGPERQAVCLRFSPGVAPDVADGRWHASQRLEPRADGALDLHLSLDGLDEVVGWVLSFGDQVEVLEPDALRERVRQVTERMAQRHAARPQPSDS
jgi:proteasome accessory factor B